MSGSVLVKSTKALEQNYSSTIFRIILKYLTSLSLNLLICKTGLTIVISPHRGLNKIIHIKGILAPCLPYSKSSANAGYYYLGVGLLLPWGVAELLLGPRGGLGVGARVTARGR